MKVILANKRGIPPHTYYKITKNLNKGLLGSDEIGTNFYCSAVTFSENYTKELMYEVSFATPPRPRVFMQLGAENISFDSHDDSQLPLNNAQLIDTLKYLGSDNLICLVLLALLGKKILIPIFCIASSNVVSISKECYSPSGSCGQIDMKKYAFFEESCRARPNGDFEDYCAETFLTCRDGFSYFGKCPTGLLFSVAARKCVTHCELSTIKIKERHGTKSLEARSWSRMVTLKEKPSKVKALAWNIFTTEIFTATRALVISFVSVVANSSGR